MAIQHLAEWQPQGGSGGDDGSVGVGVKGTRGSAAGCAVLRLHVRSDAMECFFSSLEFTISRPDGVVR